MTYIQLIIKEEENNQNFSFTDDTHTCLFIAYYNFLLAICVLLIEILDSELCYVQCAGRSRVYKTRKFTIDNVTFPSTLYITVI